MTKIPFVDLKAQYLSIKDEIDAAIADVIDHTAFIGGEQARLFEEEFAAFCAEIDWQRVTVQSHWTFPVIVPASVLQVVEEDQSGLIAQISEVFQGIQLGSKQFATR